MSNPSHPLFVTQASLPMALFEDGVAVASSRSWDALFGASPPRREVRLQATPLPEAGRFLVVATDCSDLGDEVAELRDRIEFMDWQALSLSTFAKVIAHAPIVLSSIDATGVSSMSDGKGLELLGRKPGERVGLNELDAARGTPTHGHLLRALGGETLRAISEPVPGVFFETWYTPLRNENDAIDGVIALAIDATDRVKSQVQLIENTRVIERQSETIRDLAAPIIKVWDEVICLPIIGAVDGDRASEMMQHLLESVVREKARFAILDLTGVGAVDTSTVHHILRMFKAARTLGVESVLSGAQPLIAQTIVSLGMSLEDLRTMRTLHDALSWCLARKQADASRGGHRARSSASRKPPLPNAEPSRRAQ